MSFKTFMYSIVLFTSMSGCTQAKLYYVGQDIKFRSTSPLSKCTGIITDYQQDMYNVQFVCETTAHFTTGMKWLSAKEFE